MYIFLVNILKNASLTDDEKLTLKKGGQAEGRITHCRLDQEKYGGRSIVKLLLGPCTMLYIAKLMKCFQKYFATVEIDGTQ